MVADRADQFALQPNCNVRRFLCISPSRKPRGRGLHVWGAVATPNRRRCIKRKPSAQSPATRRPSFSPSSRFPYQYSKAHRPPLQKGMREMQNAHRNALRRNACTGCSARRAFLHSASRVLVHCGNAALIKNSGPVKGCLAFLYGRNNPFFRWTQRRCFAMS